MTRLDKRSPEAAAYRILYRGKRWLALRKRIIARDRYACQRCKVFVVQGRKSPKSAVVHHIKPHKGDHYLFYDPRNLELVCKGCHDGALQSAEARGYDSTIGEDGWPIDPKHPQHIGAAPKPRT